jgi:hypothetical protein
MNEESKKKIIKSNLTPRRISNKGGNQHDKAIG